MSTLALPTTTASLFGKMQRDWHPSLLLDKYTAPPGEKSDGGQAKALQKALGAAADANLLQEALERQERAFIGATVLALKTDGPLTLHLSRANALENAGLAFHPVYGFVYLPGSGLKGLTRAWAEQMAKADEADIERIFGHQAGETGAAGTVVFHDALPTAWPALRLEITTSHHKEYYAGKSAPGDWESPNPVTFLAVAPGASFRFALSPARGGDEAAVAKAAAWLQAALCHAGAGAKTAAGYGRFIVVNPPPAPATLAIHDVTLDLVTPAFLAGAEQKKDDCDLTPGTLRGQLRWWWRTLHAKHVSLAELRRLEKLVWGGLSGFGGKEGRGSAVALHIMRVTQNRPILFEKRKESEAHKIRQPHDRRTIMGLHYGAYGMDETDSKTRERKQRHYLPEKTRWQLTISARAAEGIAAKDILTQALAALWLLCRYGGVGSKSRKGWGSFADLSFPGLPNLEACKGAAARFREAAQAKPGTVPDAMAIENAIFAEHPLPQETTDPWRVLDHAGTLLQDFAKSLAPKEERRALGLPRIIGGKQGTALKGPKGDRHASPAHFHIARLDKGFVLRLTAFPAAHLPDLEKSRDILSRLAARVTPAQPDTKAPTVAPGTPPAKPGSTLLPDKDSVWLYNEEKVRVSKQIPPNKVEIEDEDGEYIDTVLAASLKPLPK